MTVSKQTIYYAQTKHVTFCVRTPSHTNQFAHTILFLHKFNNISCLAIALSQP